MWRLNFGYHHDVQKKLFLFSSLDYENSDQNLITKFYGQDFYLFFFKLKSNCRVGSIFGPNQVYVR
jgi:hypothetical protein